MRCVNARVRGFGACLHVVGKLEVEGDCQGCCFGSGLESIASRRAETNGQSHDVSAWLLSLRKQLQDISAAHFPLARPHLPRNRLRPVPWLA